jgi:hypothetical protein
VPTLRHYDAYRLEPLALEQHIFKLCSECNTLDAREHVVLASHTYFYLLFLLLAHSGIMKTMPHLVFSFLGMVVAA